MPRTQTEREKKKTHLAQTPDSAAKQATPPKKFAGVHSVVELNTTRHRSTRSPGTVVVVVVDSVVVGSVAVVVVDSVVVVVVGAFELILCGKSGH